jgi:hypothetical protein
MSDPVGLDQLLAVLDPVWVTRILRTALTDLLAITHAAETPTPSARGNPTNGAAVPCSTLNDLPGAPPPRAAQRTARELPAKPTPARNSRKLDPSGRLPPGEWMELRQQVEAEMQRRGIGMTELSALIGRAVATVTFLMVKREPPSPQITALLRGFLAQPEMAATPGAHSAPVTTATPPAATTRRPNGQNGAADQGSDRKPAPVQSRATSAAWSPIKVRLIAAIDADRSMDVALVSRETGVPVAVLHQVLDGHVRPTEADYDALRRWLERQPDPMAELSRSVKAKRKVAALTDTTLAGVIGLPVTQLDDVLHGRPVPPEAVARLESWLAAG